MGIIDALWARSKKNTDKIAILSITVLWAREWAKWASERVSAAERASEVSSLEQANEWAVRANGRTWGPVVLSVFLVVLAHSAVGTIRTKLRQSIRKRPWKGVNYLRSERWFESDWKSLTVNLYLSWDGRVNVRSRLSKCETQTNRQKKHLHPEDFGH